MSNYNLTDNVNESFTFEIAGIVYEMQYPLVEEIEKMQELAVASVDTQRKIDDSKKKKQDTSQLQKTLLKQDDTLSEWVYKFIKPAKSDSPSIKEIMKKQNVKVLQNFQVMFKTEFGLSDG